MAAHGVKRTQENKGKNVIGHRVRRARQRLTTSVSQEDLSGRLAELNVTIGRTGVTKLENGDRYVMDYELVALADCLNTSVGWLIGEVLGQHPAPPLRSRRRREGL